MPQQFHFDIDESEEPVYYAALQEEEEEVEPCRYTLNEPVVASLTANSVGSGGSAWSLPDADQAAGSLLIRAFPQRCAEDLRQEVQVARWLSVDLAKQTPDRQRVGRCQTQLDQPGSSGT